MIFIETDGLKNTGLRPKGTVPIYMTDDYRVLEGPTYWAAEIAKKRSRSRDTLKQYTTNLARYLQWRDDEGYRAENWQNTDEVIINEYISSIIEERDEKGRPNSSSIEYYISRLQSFYKWASDNGYKHYWKVDMEKVIHTIKDKSMVSIQIESDARSFIIQNGRPTHVDAERDKFIHRENIPIVIKLFDDIVYSFMALVLWTTALRPKELFQLPYKGLGLNSGLRRYREDELEDVSRILFEFESKGKRRSIKFPIDIWAFICKEWMPLRTDRAEKYRQKHGVMPPNNVLFLSENGTIVTRKMLRDNLLKVAKKDESPEKKLNPYMFRHAFATYFVLDALMHYNLLGKSYVYNAVIDHELREWMGHTDVDTTYKYYVHLVNRYFHNDLLHDLSNPDNKEILNIIREL